MSARISKQDRLAARRRWLQEQEARRRLEAKIAELEKRGEITDAELEDLGLRVAPISPATKFMMERLNKISPNDPEFTSKSNLAIVDLVASNVPLDSRTRSLIAGTLHNLFFPNAPRDRRQKKLLEAEIVEGMKRQLLRQGMTVTEAERLIVKNKMFGIAGVSALRKRIQRS
jgi:hypothetical protein